MHEVLFHAVPRQEVASINADARAAGADVLSLVMAGARASTIETTTTRPVVRKSFAWNNLRRCA